MKTPCGHPYGLNAAMLSLLCVSLAGAQGFLLEPRLSLGDDFRAGGRYATGWATGWDAGPARWEVLGDFDVRLIPRKVRVRTSETFSYQFYETRFSAGIGALAVVPATATWDWTLGGGLSVTDGFYWGSGREAVANLAGWGETGFRRDLEDGGNLGHWGLSLQYFPQPHLHGVRVLLQLGFRLGRWGGE
jgi:hypothetical protein